MSTSALSRLCVAPGDSRSVRFSLQVVLAFLCVALALESRPPVTAASVFIAGFEWMGIGLVRMVLEPRSERWRCSFIVVAGLVAMITANFLGMWQQRATIDFIWIAWCGVPLALLLDFSSLRFGRGLTLPFALLVLASATFGLVGSASWTRPVGQVLLAIATTTATVLVIVSYLEAIERDALRTRLPIRQRSSTVVPVVGRFGMAAGGLVLLLGFALFLGLERISALWPDSPDHGPIQVHPSFDPIPNHGPDGSTTAFDPLGMPDLQASSLSPAVVAIAEIVHQDEPQKRALYLRDQVLDVYNSDPSPVLIRRTGNTWTIADEADGELDGKVPFGGAGGAFGPVPFEATQIVKVIPVERRRHPRFYEPRVVWMTSPELSLMAGGVVFDARRPHGPYEFGSIPELYLGDQFPSARSSGDAQWTEVPDFEDRSYLMSVARGLLPPGDDLERVRGLASHLRRTGTWQIPPEWKGSYRTFLEGERRALCIHFAQTAALMCRLAGLPARVAIGYLAKEYNETEQHYVIRRRHRHAWLEVEFDGLGWMAFEVTPPRSDDVDARSPEAGDVTSPTDEEAVQGDLGSDDHSEVLGEEMSQAVVGALGDRRWLWGAALLALAALGWAMLAPARWRRSVPKSSTHGPPEHARQGWELLQRFQAICARVGLRRSEGQTAREFAERIARTVPEHSEPIDRLVGVYHENRFGGRELTAEQEADLRSFLDQFAQSMRGDDAKPR